jgi:RHS repeat-associated protein
MDAIAATVIELTGWTSVPSETVGAVYRWLFGDEALFVVGTEMRLEAGLRELRVSHPETGELVLVTREEILEHADDGRRMLEAADRYAERETTWHGRLIRALRSWQSAPTSPSTTTAFLYDGQGERVLQQVTTGAATTTTVYVGDVEEVSTSGSTTTATTYYYANGKRIALGVGGTISYLASDALGSSSVTLNGSGTATASQLFAPYGSVRYSSGTMPTTFGFTGQRQDAATGLDYLHARYFDAVLGQFASADKLLQGGGFDILGLSRYAYVEDNPISRTDPTGHRVCENDYTCDGAGAISGSSNPGPAVFV